MTWLKKYCDINELIISKSEIIKNGKTIGHIDFYQENVKFIGQNYIYSFGDFYLALIEQAQFH